MQELTAGAAHHPSREGGLIAEELAEATPGWVHTCDSLAVSRATKSRRLELEGTTFTRILEEVREGPSSLRYVGGTRLCRSQVADCCSVSQTTAFHSRISSWNGAKNAAPVPGDLSRGNGPDSG